MVNIDIEVGSEDGVPDPKLSNQPVTAITCSIDGAFYTFGCGEYTPKQDNVTYTKCTNEKDLLLKFLSSWRQWDADIVTGWNVQGFDIPYMYNRISKILGEKESTSLREIYFDCEDFEEITQAALLYYNKSFVTIFSDY